MQVSFGSQHFYNFPLIYPPKTIRETQTTQGHRGNIQLQNYAACSEYVADIQKNRSAFDVKFRARKLNNLFKDENKEFSITQAAAFIKNLADKQLMLYTEDEIKQTVETVMAKNPTATRQEVLSTLAQLSSFSNYDSLDAVQMYLTENGITQIFPTDKLTVNNIFQYLTGKNYLKLSKAEWNKNKSVIFIDRNTVELLKEMKKVHPYELESIKGNVLTGKSKLVLLDGWEAKTKNGFRSFNIVGKWGDLAETASEIIQTKSEMPKDFSVFNDDIEQDINEIFEEDMPLDVIRNIPDNIDEKEIANRLNSKTFSETDIAEAIKDAAQKPFCPNVNNPKQKSLESLVSFIFALSNNIYSPRRLATEMKRLNKKLSDRAFYYDKPVENLVFIVPSKEKSFGLTNYQFSKVNDIPLSRFIYINKNNMDINIPNKKNKVFVICDDFSGSGHSMLWELFPYRRFRTENHTEPLIFAPIAYTAKAEENIKKAIDEVQGSKFLKDSIAGETFVCGFKDYINILSHRKRNLLDSSFDAGYLDGGMSIAFPHVIPDNCTDISGKLFEYILRNTKANKARRREK